MPLPRLSSPWRQHFARAMAAVLLAVAAACGDGTGPDEPRETLDLSVGAAYIVQSTQTRDGSVPLVAGRPGVLRVFPVANAANTVAPAVSAQIWWGSTLKQTLTATAPGPSVPTAVDQGSLAGSWNFDVPGDLIQPGLRIEVVVDPQDAVGETNDGNNGLPGGPRDVSVAALAPLRIRFVPLHQTDNQLTGNVTDANKEQFLALTRKVHPVHEVDADVRAAYSVSGLGFDPQGNTWQIALSELDAVRVAEGSGRYYYGVVQTPYPGGGVVGIGFIGGKTSLGWDRMPYADETLAHELGHNWGRRHAPCGGAGGVDPQYPYSIGLIGSYGMDVETREIKGPSDFTDIMGYCDAAFWISDYTYQGVYGYRLANDGLPTAAPRPALLVWGRIDDGELTLEPAFEITTRPALPAGPGPYTLDGRDDAGARIFSISFAGDRVSDRAGDHRQFAFAVPIDPSVAERLATLRLHGDGEAVERTAHARIGVAAASAPRLAVTRRAAGELDLQWDAAVHPAVMVRDAATGAVLALARGGSASVRAGAGVELFFSDGVRTTAILAR